MQVVVNSLLVNYRRSGKGKVLVLLHGWGDSAKGLTQLQAELSKNYDVVSIDLPGFGGSEPPKETWGLSEYAQCVADFCEKLRLTPFAYLGHSNGGAIAIRGLGTQKLRSEKLVLLASAGIRGEYKGRVLALRLLAKTGKLVTAPLPRTVKKKLQKKVYTTVGSDMLVAEHLQDTFKKVVTDDVRKDAARITTPTLLIYGENDQATPAKWGRMLHEIIGNSEFLLIKDAEHFVHKDAAAEVTQAVRKYLS